MLCLYKKERSRFIIYEYHADKKKTTIITFDVARRN